MGPIRNNSWIFRIYDDFARFPYFSPQNLLLIRNY